MAYITTAALGLKLADPGTIQPFETQFVNDNFLALETAVTADTGWITPTLINGWTAAVGYAVGYRILRGVVYMRGQVTGGTGQNIFSLPSGSRPLFAFRTFVRSASSTTVSIGMQVFPDGTVQVDGGYAGLSPNLAGIPPFIAEQ